MFVDNTVIVPPSSMTATTSGMTSYLSGPYTVGAPAFTIQPTPPVPAATVPMPSCATVMPCPPTQNFVASGTDAVQGPTFPVPVAVAGTSSTTAVACGSASTDVRSTVDGASLPTSTAGVVGQSSTTSTSSGSGSGPPSGTSSPPPPPVDNGSSTSPSSSGTTVPPPSTTSTSSTSPPVVVVRQFQTVRPYSGKTSWKLFRDYFRRVAKVNSWTTPEEQIQHLVLSLDRAAAEVLRDFDENLPTAVDDLWQRLAHRFGSVDEMRKAMREFDARRQSDTESLVEYEQALRSLYKVAWPTASSETRDAALKRRFEDGILSSELTQYLRLHCRDLTFEQTVEKARIYHSTTDGTKPKKAIRYVAEPDADPKVLLINHLKSIEGRLDKVIRDTKPAASTAPSPSPTPSSTSTTVPTSSCPATQPQSNWRPPVNNNSQATTMADSRTSSRVNLVSSRVHQHLRQPRSTLRRRRTTALLDRGLDTDVPVEDA